MLGDILYNYSQLKEVAKAANYLDITLVDEENSIIIYKQLQDVQFYIDMEYNSLKRIIIKVEHIMVLFENLLPTREFACKVETVKDNSKKVFYPTLITVFN